MAQMQSTGAGIRCWHFTLTAERNSSISLHPTVRLHCNYRISGRMYSCCCVFFFFVMLSVRQTFAWSLLFLGH